MSYSSLRQFYILTRFKEKMGGLDDFYSKQLSGIKVLHPDFTLSMIKEEDKQALEKQVNQMVSSAKMVRAK